MRYALRLLGRTPGFTLIALLAIAAGVGANTAIFSVVNAVLLRPLPYPESDRLVILLRQFPSQTGDSLSGTRIHFIQRKATTLEEVAAHDVLAGGMNVLGGSQPERVPGMRVSERFFHVFGIQPALGRGFAKEECIKGAPDVAVISDGLWKRRFGGDSNVIGQTVRTATRSFQIVGVMPPGFSSTPAADIWTPLPLAENPEDKANMFFGVARRKPGVTLEATSAEMVRVHEEFRREYPQLVFSPRESMTAMSLHQYMVGDVRKPLLVLLGAVGLVLLIACANVASLLLARATGRQKEIAIRSALGAGQNRILKQLMAESLVLSLGGGMLGLLLAAFSLRWLMGMAGGMLPSVVQVSLDWNVLGFTLLLSVVTGILFGLAPAWHGSKVDLNHALRETSGRTSQSAARARMRASLVALEVALAVILLTGATLLMRTYRNLMAVDLGFDQRNVLTLQAALAGTPYIKTEALDTYLRRLRESIAAVPGVVAVAEVTSLPTELAPDLPVTIPALGEDPQEAQWRNIGPDFFNVMGVKVTEGRAFSGSDGSKSEMVAVVNQVFVDRYLKGRPPIGEQIHIGKIMGPEFAETPRRIVGVSAPVRDKGASRPSEPTVYVPTPQIKQNLLDKLAELLPVTIVVKTAGSPLATLEPVRRAALSVDSNMPLANARTLESVLSASTSRQQLNSVLLGLFAILALVLASIGIYGLLAYAIAQRTNEIGIRIALGAAPGGVAGMVLRQSLWPALAGIGTGLTGAFALSRFLESQLYGVKARDPISFLTVPVILLAICLLASAVPAMRAAAVDPALALRNE